MRRGNLRRGGCGVRRRTHCAPSALRSNNCGESVNEAWALRRPCSPRNRPDAGAASRGWTAEQPHSHTGLCFARPRGRGAQRLRVRGRAQRSEAMARMDVGSPAPLYAPRSAAGGVACVPQDTHASWSSPPQLFERSCKAAQRVLRRTPFASTAGCPSAQRWGRRQRGRLFFGDFLLAKQKKATRPPGDSRPPP